MPNNNTLPKFPTLKKVLKCIHYNDARSNQSNNLSAKKRVLDYPEGLR